MKDTTKAGSEIIDILIKYELSVGEALGLLEMLKFCFQVCC